MGERPWYQNVGSFGPHPYTGLAEDLRNDGVEIKTLRVLAADPR